jgi:hypothetical protein
MVRSVDQLERVEGTPDSVVFYVNFAPRFLTRRDSTFVQFPMPGDVFQLADLLANDLTVNFLVENIDAAVGELIRYGVRFESDFDREPRPQAETLQAVPTGIPYTVVVRPVTGWRVGEYSLIVLAEDNRMSGGESSRGIRATERAVPIRVVAR